MAAEQQGDISEVPWSTGAGYYLLLFRGSVPGGAVNIQGRVIIASLRYLQFEVCSLSAALGIFTNGIQDPEVSPSDDLLTRHVKHSGITCLDLKWLQKIL